MSGLAVHARQAGWRQSLAVTAVVVLVVVGLYEAAIALEIIPMGDEPGENAFGAQAMRFVGELTLLAGVFVTIASVRAPEAISRLVRQLIPLAAAGLVVATACAFDPYYGGSEQRYVDGTPAPAWLVFVVVAALFAALLARADARVGLGATALVLLVCLGTLSFTGVGH